MATAEVTKPSGTYGWLANTPLAASAGSVVYSWYESSKNCCRVSKFALATVESSASYFAEATAPLVKRLDAPLHTVDTLALKGLEKLEEKVPAIKKEPGEVMELLSEGKNALYTRFSDGKQVVYDRLYSGKETIATSITSGKEAIASTLATGKGAIFTRLEYGADALVNSRAGYLVGSSVDCTLSTTESIVDYLLPPEPNEKELLDDQSEAAEEEMSVEKEEGSQEEEEGKSEDKGRKRWRWRWRRKKSRKGKKVEEREEEEEEEEEGEEGEGVVAVATPSRYTRIKALSRKVKLRMYYRTLRTLQTIQQQCKTTLDQLKLSVDVLKIAQSTRAGVGYQYERAQDTLRSLEAQLKTLLSLQGKATGETITLVHEPSGEESDDDIQWLTPQEEKTKTFLQATLDYAKQLSEKIYGALQSVVQATTYLPHHLKEGATQAYTQAHDLYISLKPVKVPTDLPTSTLNRISEVIETQRGYLKGLGEYISSILSGKAGRRTQEEAESTTSASESDSSSEEEAEEEEEEEDPSLDPAASRQA